MRTMQNITRDEHNYAKAWRVQIERRRRKRIVVTRLFSDLVYGGKRKARKAAIRFRDRQLKILGLPQKNQYV